jgi:PPP family 3-phenylpropionic acid transporter
VSSSEPAAYRLAVFYWLLFMAVGITLPFVPQYLSSLGLSAGQIGLLLAVAPVFAIIGPPLWGQVSDRLGRPGLVLLILVLGSLAGYSLLSTATGFGGALFALCVQAAFGSSISTVADSLALHHVRVSGASYPRLRAWGSFGFVLSTVSFGFWVRTIDVRAIQVAMAILVVCAVWTATALARAPAVLHHGPRPSVAAALALVRRPEIALFLLASALHWVACAPYHGSLSLHLTALGHPPWVVSLASSVAVTSELLVMVSYGRWSPRLSVPSTLALAFAGSALRWWGVALTDTASLLIAISALHGLTFGVFYVSAVAFMSDRVPPSLRATGQALFVAATFGVGGLLGFIGSGRLYQALGGHWLFALAGVLELLPLALVAFTCASARRPL